MSAPMEARKEEGEKESSLFRARVLSDPSLPRARALSLSVCLPMDISLPPSLPLPLPLPLLIVAVLACPLCKGGRGAACAAPRVSLASQAVLSCNLGGRRVSERGGDWGFARGLEAEGWLMQFFGALG